jgi:hypothetical protein
MYVTSEMTLGSLSHSKKWKNSMKKRITSINVMLVLVHTSDYVINSN